jgi:hypothetical protein
VRARAVSSAGRAPALQAGGHWFKPSTAHSLGVARTSLRRARSAGRARKAGQPLAVLPPRLDRASARWHARFVLEARGITAAEAALALLAAQGLAGLKTREIAAQILRRLARAFGLSGVDEALRTYRTPQGGAAERI